MATTPYTAVLLIVGCLVVLAGSALALYVVARPAGSRKLPARQPELGLVRNAGRVYVSSRAGGGVAPTRDSGRVAAPQAATVATLPPAFRPARQRMHAEVSR